MDIFAWDNCRRVADGGGELKSSSLLEAGLEPTIGGGGKRITLDPAGGITLRGGGLDEGGGNWDTCRKLSRGAPTDIFVPETDDGGGEDRGIKSDMTTSEASLEMALCIASGARVAYSKEGGEEEAVNTVEVSLETVGFFVATGT